MTDDKLNAEQKVALAEDLRAWGMDDAADSVAGVGQGRRLTPEEAEEAQRQAAGRGLLDHLNRTVTPWLSTEEGSG